MAWNNEQYMEVVYLEHNGAGDGKSKDNPLPISSGNLVTPPADVVVTEAYMDIEVAVAGSTAVTIGDSGDPDGLIAAIDVTLGTPAVYAGAGAELPKKLAGSALQAAVTGASSAGKLKVVLLGYRAEDND